MSGHKSNVSGHKSNVSGHKSNVSGHKRVWAQTSLGTVGHGLNRVVTIMSGPKWVWAQSCLCTNVSGHKRVWAQSCAHSGVGPIMYGHKCGGTAAGVPWWQATTRLAQRLRLFTLSFAFFRKN